MKVAVYYDGDDTFGEIWEIDKKWSKEIFSLLGKEDTYAIYEILQQNGKNILDKCDLHITLR